MKLSFTDTPIANAPVGYVRVRITEERITRFVREKEQKREMEWLEIGAGPWEEVSPRNFLIICRTIVQTAKAQGLTKIAVELSKSPFPQMKPFGLPEIGRRIAESFEMANFEFDRFKTPSKDTAKPLAEILICGVTPADMKKGFEKGKMVAEGVNACPELAN